MAFEKFLRSSSTTKPTTSQGNISAFEQSTNSSHLYANRYLIRMVNHNRVPPSAELNKLIPPQTTALKSIKSLAPLLDRILVQRIKAEAKTAGGIFLPESSVKELNEARVLAVGPGGLDKEGKRVTPSVTPGDKVLIPQVGYESQIEVHRKRLANALCEVWRQPGEGWRGGVLAV